MIVRTSSSMQFNESLSMISKQQSRLNELREQITTGKKILRPSDDPVMAARITTVKQTSAQIVQFNRTSSDLKGNLSYQEEVIQQAIDALQKAREGAIRSSSPAINQDNAQAIAQEIYEISELILGVANTRDENNAHIFAGFKSDTAAYTVARNTDNNISTGLYAGDSNFSYRDVGLGQKINSNVPGESLFNTASGDSVFSALGKFANELETGTPVTSALNDIDDVMNKLIEHNSKIGVRINQVNAMTSINQSLSFSMETAIAEVEGLDMTEGLLELSQLQAGYQASLQTFAQVQQLNLFKFM